MGKVKLIIGLIILLVGVAFALSPEAVASYFSLSLETMMMQVIGAIIAIVGIFVIIKGRH
jgi:hypothetical protein